MIEPRFTRTGDSMLFTWDEFSLGVGLDEWKEHGDGIFCEATFYTVEDGKISGRLRSSRLNILADPARSGALKGIRDRTSKIMFPDGFDLGEIVDYVCDRAKIEYRRGEPIQDLADIEVSNDSRFVIDKILPHGQTTLIYADGGSGKSLLAMAIACAVRTGVSLPGGLAPTSQGAVLYLDWETTPEAHSRRLRRVAAGLGLQAVPHILYRTMSRPIAEEVQRLRKEIADQGVVLVIIDSIAAACGAEPSDAGAALATMNAIRDLQVTRLGIAHVTHSATKSDDGVATPFGSRFFWNYTRSAFELKRVDDETRDAYHVGLYHRKSNEDRLMKEPIGLTFNFYPRGEPGFEDLGGGGPVVITNYSVAGDLSLSRKAPPAYRIRDALSRGDMTIKEMSDLLDLKEDIIKATIIHMGDVVNLNATGMSGRFGLSVGGRVDDLFMPEPELSLPDAASYFQ